ncbi:hypothetical protein SBA3_1820059 [Candidatus Sulfopaludibacter sp. SbA3]|nr:hypothetical protein SBA3_1820059 [Candidatus Sulfopaludibacter sp. SbA3]
MLLIGLVGVPQGTYQQYPAPDTLLRRVATDFGSSPKNWDSHQTSPPRLRYGSIAPGASLREVLYVTYVTLALGLQTPVQSMVLLPQHWALCGHLYSRN